VLNDVVLNQVLVSFSDAETTNRVIAALQADGTCWCGGTIWQGQAAMRISVVMGDERSVIGHTARRWHAGRLATDLTMHTVLVIHEQ